MSDRCQIGVRYPVAEDLWVEELVALAGLVDLREDTSSGLVDVLQW